KAIVQLPTKKITIEIKSLNSKNIDLNARVPSYYREKELDMRKKIAIKLERGKIDFSIFVELTAEETAAKVNKPIVLSYINQLREIASADDFEMLKLAVKLPDALKVERDELDELEWEEVDLALEESLQKIMQYRLDEGAVLQNEFKNRLTNIENLLEEITNLDVARVEKIRERLYSSLAEIMADFDQNRLEQELIFYLEKLDITEEIVRLKNHLSYFVDELNNRESNGKKLGFISQEMGREINTIGSKANDAPMQKKVVMMKDELEKIKEQLLNVL
ncbi:MAG: YicC/YloC family endoribonuclease, partial [Flavobacteriaceae bacterium]|nr:YicC/YloC family endoribonuclease [Flavobacteriaceae bacterium]